jgi:hypothetical protein
MAEHRMSLPTAPAPCWRCGGPSQRQGLRYDLCPTCTAMLAEVQTRYQGPRPEEGATHDPAPLPSLRHL